MMHNFQKYTELRQNIHAPTSETSLWPSFTDIMTVILMIFMLTMIAVIIKNSNLRQRLDAVLDRGKEIEWELQQSEEDRGKLEVKLTSLDEKLRSKQMEIILLKEEKKVTKSTLENKLALISALEAQKADSHNKISALKQKIKLKDEKLAAISALEQEIRLKDEEIQRKNDAIKDKEEEVRLKDEEVIEMTAELEKKIDEFNKKFAALMAELEKERENVFSISVEQKELELSLANQRKEYLTLEEKYNKLVGPARSSLGKKVATVIYSKKGIFYKNVDAENSEKVSLSGLHMKLSATKEQYKDKLYVKIVIPEDSGLSYNAVWKFTNEILSKYDYYYSKR